MAGNEKDKLTTGIKRYFSVQQELKRASEQLDRDREDQQENEKVESNQREEPDRNE